MDAGKHQSQHTVEEVTSKRTRVLFTIEQLAYLDEIFAKNEYVTTLRRHEIALKLGVSAEKVKVWFQNRRMRKKAKPKGDEQKRSYQKRNPSMKSSRKPLPRKSPRPQLNSKVNGYNEIRVKSAVPIQQSGISFSGPHLDQTYLQLNRNPSSESKVMQNAINEDIHNSAYGAFNIQQENPSNTYNHYKKGNFSSDFWGHKSSSVHASAVPIMSQFDNVAAIPNGYPGSYKSSYNQESPPNFVYNSIDGACTISNNSHYGADYPIAVNGPSSYEPYHSNNFAAQTPMEHQAPHYIPTANYAHLNNYHIYPVKYCKPINNFHFENQSTMLSPSTGVSQYSSSKTSTSFTPSDSESSGYESTQSDNSWYEQISSGNWTEYLPYEMKHHTGLYENINHYNSENFANNQNLYPYNDHLYSQRQCFRRQNINPSYFENRVGLESTTDSSFDMNGNHQNSHFTTPHTSSILGFYQNSCHSSISPINSGHFQVNEAGSSEKFFKQCDSTFLNECDSKISVDGLYSQLHQPNIMEFDNSQMHQPNLFLHPSIGS